MVTPKVQSSINCSIVSDNFLTQLVLSPTRGTHILESRFYNLQTILVLYPLLKLSITYQELTMMLMLTNRSLLYIDVAKRSTDTGHLLEELVEKGKHVVTCY